MNQETRNPGEDLIELPCISLWQPWAQWIAWGWKTIETRLHSRFVDALLGKQMGIHAALTWDVDALRVAKPYLNKSEIARTWELLRSDWPRGVIICAAQCYQSGLTEPRDEFCALIECQSPRFGLWLENVRLFNSPIKEKGRQGIWKARIPANLIRTAKLVVPVS